MKAQIFSKAIPSLNMPAKFNPYFAVGSFELAIDSDGILLCFGGKCCGYIRGAGFHRGFGR